MLMDFCYVVKMKVFASLVYRVRRC